MLAVDPVKPRNGFISVPSSSHSLPAMKGYTIAVHRKLVSESEKNSFIESVRLIRNCKLINFSYPNMYVFLTFDLRNSKTFIFCHINAAIRLSLACL